MNAQIMKAHKSAGLNTDGQVMWVNHLGQQIPATVTLGVNKIWAVRSVEDGSVLTSGGHGKKFSFAY